VPFSTKSVATCDSVSVTLTKSDRARTRSARECAIIPSTAAVGSLAHGHRKSNLAARWDS
jgi:hypothetical protein